MMNMKRALLSASLLAFAAGCGGGAGSDNQSSASANMEAPGTNGMAEAMPSGPFAQIEMQMHERMMAATGGNASETWARKMIEHHRGAVQMSQLLIDQGGDPQMVQMARATIEKQQAEIGELERALAGGIAGGSGEANPYGPVEQNMHRQMMAATGGNLSETWARKMIAHHQGAVDMSEVLIRQGGNPQVLAMARRTAQDQRREIAHLEAMLRGEPMPAAAGATGSPRPAPARAGGDTKAPPARRPAEPDRATPRPAPRPAPPATPAPACAPEHRAAGHC